MAETRSSSSGTTCPLGTLRCRAVDVQSIVFFWYFEDESVVEYLLDEQQYPIFLSLPPRLADIATVAIVNASRSSIGASFESVLRGNLSALREAGGTSISCGSAFIRSNIISNHFSISEDICCVCVQSAKLYLFSPPSFPSLRFLFSGASH